MGKYIDAGGLSHFMGIIKGALAGKSNTGHTHSQYVTDVAYNSTSRKLTQSKNGAAVTDIVTLAAVATSGSYNDLSNKPDIPSANSTATNIKMDGTQSAGSLATFAKADHVHPSDTSRVPTTRTVNGHALSADVTLDGSDIMWEGADETVEEKISAMDSKLDTIAQGAEVNQNAFSNVKVGTTTIAADTKTDTLELVAGTNVTITPDATNDKVTIASTFTDTKNTAGSTDSSSKLFLIGATTQAAQPQTYSQDTAYVGTDGHLYSDSKQVVNLSGTQALTNKTYNGYTLAAACAKGVDTSISSGSTSANLPTTAAVVKYIGEVAGALVYKGTVSAASGMANFKAGWFWIATGDGFDIGSGTAIEHVEPGDMLIANASAASATAANIDVVQTNIDTLSNDEIDALWAAA